MLYYRYLSEEVYNMAHILVVDDEEVISDLIVMNLNMVGFTCSQAFSGQEALEAIKQMQYDLCLLDVLLPGKDGFQLIDKFKEANIPVIYLTAKNSLTDRVKGLNLGAEDYIVKPFETLELIARIKVVLRRNGKDHKNFRLKDIEVSLAERSIAKNNVQVELTAQEFALLEVLIQNQNLALTREQLLEAAWGYDYAGETRTVDMHIQRLRKKLDWEDTIKTVYKYGYRLEVPKG